MTGEEADQLLTGKAGGAGHRDPNGRLLGFRVHFRFGHYLFRHIYASERIVIHVYFSGCQQ